MLTRAGADDLDIEESAPVAFHEHLLKPSGPIPSFVVQADHFGPTWEENPDWDGLNDYDRYLLPQYTLGYEAIAWARANILSPDSTTEDQKPFIPTFEQYRIILWWYAVDENGEFVYREGILQRIKGWGKDPIVAVLALIEFLGPCRFDGWALQDMPNPIDPYTQDEVTKPDGSPLVSRGDPVARDNPVAWIQVAAVSKTQTRNTMLLFPQMMSERLKKAGGIRKNDIGINIITAYANTRRIEAVTSNPRTLEGGRATFIIKNETHHWLSTNNGHQMAEVIDRNAVKSKGGHSRSLSITNAYKDGEDSTAQREREAWELQESGEQFKTGVLYDSLEMPKTVGLRPPRKDDEPEHEEAVVRAWLRAVLISVRGDSVWLNIRRISDAILNPKNSAATSRRFYLNQAWSDEEAWVDARAVIAAIDPLAKSERRLAQADGRDLQRCGWIVAPADPVVMFFDGSKNDDSTVLIGCRISDGYVFTIGTWNRPMQKERAKTWLVPRMEVDDRVREAFGRFNIVAFFADPSHTVDDSQNRYWDSLIDRWHREYSDRLQVWSIKTGPQAHSIMWDMTSRERQRLFVSAAEMTAAEMQRQDDFEEFQPEFTHDGDPVLIKHLQNARDYPTEHGTSLAKEGRESLKKVDAAVGLVGARMLRRLVLNSGLEEEKPNNKVGWGYAV